MKVLLVNGSPHKNSCTCTALGAVGDALNQNGVTRNAMFWSRVLSVVLAALALSLISLMLGALTRLLCATTDSLYYLSRMDVYYPLFRDTAATAVRYLAELAFDLPYFILAMSAGYLAAILFHRVSRNTFFIAVISAVVLLFLILPFLDRILLNGGISNLYNGLKSALLGIDANAPFLGALTLFLLSAALNLAIWLSLRWMPVKD